MWTKQKPRMANLEGKAAAQDQPGRHQGHGENALLGPSLFSHHSNPPRPLCSFSFSSLNLEDRYSFIKIGAGAALQTVPLLHQQAGLTPSLA